MVKHRPAVLGRNPLPAHRASVILPAVAPAGADAMRQAVDQLCQPLLSRRRVSSPAGWALSRSPMAASAAAQGCFCAPTSAVFLLALFHSGQLGLALAFVVSARRLFLGQAAQLLDHVGLRPRQLGQENSGRGPTGWGRGRRAGLSRKPASAADKLAIEDARKLVLLRAGLRLSRRWPHRGRRVRAQIVAGDAEFVQALVGPEIDALVSRN